jgi:ketosteroid isomerase-like protein
MIAVIDHEFASAFAAEWIDAWNAHDLERVLSNYSEAFEMSSPLIVERGLDPSGTLRGKPAIRAYWAAGLAMTPPIRFELIDVYAGAHALTLHYKRLGQRLVTETLVFDDANRLVVRGWSCWGARL